jgi:hypothetical protein
LYDIRGRHPKVLRISPDDPQLRILLLHYRERFEIGDGLGHLPHALWYGVTFAQNTLAAVVGFQEQRNITTDESWLFICDFTCLQTPEGFKALATLTSFIEDIPYRLQGLVAAGNPTMLKFLENRSRAPKKRAWCHKATLVESGPL